MSLQPPNDLLTTLRRNLHLIERSTEDGLSPEAFELKTLLLCSIAVIEAAIARTEKSAVLQTKETKPGQ